MGLLIEGLPMTVTAQVQNVTSSNCTSDITATLYDSDPHSGGVQVGADQVISGGLSAASAQQVQFANFTAGIEEILPTSLQFLLPVVMLRRIIAFPRMLWLVIVTRRARK